MIKMKTLACLLSNVSKYMTTRGPEPNNVYSLETIPTKPGPFFQQLRISIVHKLRMDVPELSLWHALVLRACARKCLRVMVLRAFHHCTTSHLHASLRLECRASKDLGISYGSFALQKSRHVETRRTLLSAHHRFYTHRVLVQASSMEPVWKQ